MTTFIYIVTWTIVSFVPEPCPDFSIANEYGLKYVSHCAVLHGRNEYENRSRQFLTRDSAVAFINGGKTPITYYNAMGGVRDFKLDSVEVKQ